MAFRKISKAKQSISSYFSNANRKVYRIKDLRIVLAQNRTEWNLAENITSGQFISYLLFNTPMKMTDFNFPNRKYRLYSWGQISVFELLSFIDDKAYFSHYSALYLNELTEQVPSSIYLNIEQKPQKFRDFELTQTRIESAFKNKQRLSNNHINYEDHKIYLLNGMNTGNLGVITSIGADNQEIHYTNVERTLIDIVVRPAYSGGVYEILKAFALAQPKVSINRLVAFLQKLNFIYPYHQAIGFYLEKSGAYRDSQINQLNTFDVKYDFFLAHNIPNTCYSDRWKLFYPEGL